MGVIDEVIETQESPRRNGRGAGWAAGGLLVVVALLGVWLVARDDPDGVEATNGGGEVAKVYRLPEGADLADLEIDAGGGVDCTCLLEEIGAYALLPADVARTAVTEGNALVISGNDTNDLDVSDALAEVGATVWSGTNAFYVLPTWRFTVEGGETIEVLAIDPDTLFAPSGSTTTTSDISNVQTTVPADDTTVPGEVTVTTEAGVAAAKGVLKLHIANTTSKPVEFFFETTDGQFATSVFVEGGESGDTQMTVPTGCIEFTVNLGVGTAGATESAIVGREPVDVYGGYVPDRADPIQLGLELPDDQVGCAG